jgi:hypothetical protein
MEFMLLLFGKKLPLQMSDQEASVRRVRQLRP